MDGKFLLVVSIVLCSTVSRGKTGRSSLHHTDKFCHSPTVQKQFLALELYTRAIET